MNSVNSAVTRFTVLLFLISAASLLRADVIQLNPQAATAFGFSLPGVINPVVDYTVGGQAWQTTTDPLVYDSASTLESEGLANPFLNALSSGLFPGAWTFGYNTAALADNTFQVGTYEAQGPPPPVSNTNQVNNAGCPSPNSCVGSAFFLNYVPTGNDPTANIHWVQIVLASYTVNGRIPTPQYSIDVVNADRVAQFAITPYYDAGFAANSSSFLDIPFITGPDQPTDFDALTLLVSGPNTFGGNFTIYGGVQWGWSNEVVPRPNAVTAAPEPSSVVFLVPILLVLAQIIRKRTRAAAGCL